MVTAHSERDAARHDQRQNYRGNEDKPLDHFPLLIVDGCPSLRTVTPFCGAIPPGVLLAQLRVHHLGRLVVILSALAGRVCSPL
jgi:hypothetical protein